MDVLNKVIEPRLVLCDTMNLWIDTERPTLLKLLKRVDILTVNDSEARQLSGKMSIPAAADWILAHGPTRVIVKRGEHGVSLFSRDGMFSLPAYPVAKPVDPTGAGDSFAGGFIGYLASRQRTDETAMRQALVIGSVLASFCVENFSLGALFNLKSARITERCEAFHRATQFKPFKISRWKE
jgi:sugar/nucleoside kinase (ribokinase family)